MSNFYVDIFNYYAKPFARKKSLSSMEKILLAEESRAELVISKIRIGVLTVLLLFSLDRFFFEGGVTFTRSVLPNLLFLIFSISLHYKIYVISNHKELIEKYYFAIIKYVIILYDTIFFTWLIVTNIKILGIGQWNILALYILFFAFLVITDIFRYDFFSSIYCGVLIFISRLSIQFFTEIEVNPLILVSKGKPHFQNITFLLTIITFTLLSCLISRHIRKILEKSKRQDTLEKYVPEIIAREIMSTDRDITSSGTKGDVTILFSDIRNFTTISEKLTPIEVIEFLNEYFKIMIDIVFKYDGMLDKIIGDGLMAIFGSPFAKDQNPELNALNSVKAALEMERELENLNIKLIERGLEKIEIGIGINSGEAVLGDIGTEQRVEFTAIGDVVNTASRIESYTKEASESILISEATRELINSTTLNTKSIGPVELKGKKEEVHLYSVS